MALPLFQSPKLTLSQKIKAKLQNPDLLELCHSVPKEVVQLGEAWEPKMADYLCVGILYNPGTVGAILLAWFLPGEWKFVDLVVAKWTRPPHLSGVCPLSYP